MSENFLHHNCLLKKKKHFKHHPKQGFSSQEIAQEKPTNKEIYFDEK